MLAAANSGIDFLLPPEDQSNRGEIIEILDNENNDILDEYMKEERLRNTTKNWRRSQGWRDTQGSSQAQQQKNIGDESEIE